MKLLALFAAPCVTASTLAQTFVYEGDRMVYHDMVGNVTNG